jgi:hypothetical protein
MPFEIFLQKDSQAKLVGSEEDYVRLYLNGDQGFDSFGFC